MKKYKTKYKTKNKTNYKTKYKTKNKTKYKTKRRINRHKYKYGGNSSIPSDVEPDIPCVPIEWQDFSGKLNIQNLELEKYYVFSNFDILDENCEKIEYTLKKVNDSLEILFDNDISPTWIDFEVISDRGVKFYQRQKREAGLREWPLIKTLENLTYKEKLIEDMDG
jgi:hypothetical protein